MSVTVLWRDRAIHEAQEAYDWYEAQTKGVGERLLAELEEHIDFLLKHPTGYPKWRSSYRKVMLRHFPYQVIYRFEKGIIIIFSILHGSRDPKRWGRPH